MTANSKAATRNDINYLGSFAGLMTATPSDANTKPVPKNWCLATSTGPRLLARA